jgi:hypothetical protein
MQLFVNDPALDWPSSSRSAADALNMPQACSTIESALASCQTTTVSAAGTRLGNLTFQV